MHQLTKDPERVMGRGDPTNSSPKRTYTHFELVRYLDYCSELLSLISKIGTIYVQDFADRVALESVDQLSTLTNGLSRSIWQKIIIVENMLGPPGSHASHREGAIATQGKAPARTTVAAELISYHSTTAVKSLALLTSLLDVLVELLAFCHVLIAPIDCHFHHHAHHKR